MSNPDKWFKNEILTGLQKLATLSLPNTPAAETLPLTAATWIDTLWIDRAWEQSLDVERIRAAFIELCRRSERFPIPKQFIDHLPKRQPVKALPPANDLTPEKLEENKRRLKALLKGISTRV